MNRRENRRPPGEQTVAGVSGEKNETLLDQYSAPDAGSAASLVSGEGLFDLLSVALDNPHTFGLTPFEFVAADLLRGLLSQRLSDKGGA